jgi:hypothetical protein
MYWNDWEVVTLHILSDGDAASEVRASFKLQHSSAGLPLGEQSFAGS